MLKAIDKKLFIFLESKFLVHQYLRDFVFIYLHSTVNYKACFRFHCSPTSSMIKASLDTGYLHVPLVFTLVFTLYLHEYLPLLST